MMMSNVKERDTLWVPSPEKIHYLTMNLQQWINVPDNPRQRDTERRLETAKHLHTPSPTQALVHMAVFGLKQWKLDGHTRALLWSRKPELAPKTIHVVCYDVDSEEEAKTFYTHFDNMKAAETSADKISGAFRESGFHPLSAKFRKGDITASIRRADNIVHGLRQPEEIYSILPRWLPELELLDSINPRKTYFNQITITAALLILRRRGSTALEFWRLYNTDCGNKVENEVDAVEALIRAVKGKMFNALSGSDITLAVARVISIFEQWRRNGTYKIHSGGGLRVKPTNLRSYFGIRSE